MALPGRYKEKEMLQITILPEIAAKFKELLEEEGEDAVVRIRETKVGGGCKSRIVLKVSIDEREDPDDEEEVVVEGVPIVASNEVIESYGNVYEFFVDEHNMPAVRCPNPDGQACSKTQCGNS